jgi:two-component system, sensor histidine kinase and response regulator
VKHFFDDLFKINKPKILIIDDTPDNVQILLKLLSRLGYTVLVATDGESGIEQALYAEPDLILLDIMMPGLDGFQVCSYLKNEAKTEQIPVIFVSALDTIDDKVTGFGLGAADYITKPFNKEEVISRINTHLRLYFLQRKLEQHNITLQNEIEERKKLEISLKNTTEALAKHMLILEQTNAELDAFAHTVAHDLKNPLGAIINLSEVLISNLNTHSPPSQKSLERLGMINQAGEQMLNIIKALLLLAGVSKQTELDIKTLDMQQIVIHVLEKRLPTLIEQYQADIILPSSWHNAEGYEPWVEEIWMNYLSNALKYGGKPPRLELGSELDGDYVRFWVHDNGQGIDAKCKTHLFRIFKRLDTNRADGNGLGLSIVKRIAERLGGTVGVDSQPGQGSTFYFTLPIKNK